VLSTPDNIAPLWLTSIFSGVFWPGVNQGLSNVLMERAPAQQRGAAMAAFSAITGVGTLVSGFLGGALAATLVGAQFGLGPVSFGGLAVLFVASSLGRLALAAMFWRTL
jgi:fatty acid desaturase